jgi:hypothetical protein
LLTVIAAGTAQPTAQKPATTSNKPPSNEPSASAPANQPTEMLAEHQLMQLSNEVLKKLLRSLSTIGGKAVMVQRMLDY